MLLIAGMEMCGQFDVLGSIGFNGFSLDNGISVSTEGSDRFENVESYGLFGYDASVSVLFDLRKNWKVGAGINGNSRHSYLQFDYMVPDGPNDFEFRRFGNEFFTQRIGLSAMGRYQMQNVFFHASLTACKVTRQNLNPESITYGYWVFNEAEYAQVRISEEYHGRDKSFNEVFTKIGCDVQLKKNLLIGVSLGISGLRMKHGHRLYSFHHTMSYDLEENAGIEISGKGSIEFYETKYFLGINVSYVLPLGRKSSEP
jgi:hypothetical protein